MAGIEVQLLGRFLVRRGGEEVPAASFGGRLVRVLIRILVSRRGRFVSRDVLAESLWPERMPADRSRWPSSPSPGSERSRSQVVG